MTQQTKYSPQVRERAVRMVLRHQHEHPSTVGGDLFDHGQDRLYRRDLARLCEAG